MLLNICMVTEEILFSIIIPTYNRADLIMETLQTVFDQTYAHYEAIVVDNCSTDNTEEILKPFVTKRKIRYIRHDKNYERSKSRNTGMCAAKGDFLTFLDSDDFMYKDCLKDAADFIYKNPEIKFFQNLYELVNNNKERIYSYKFPSLNNQYKALANGNFVSCIGGFLHRDIYKEIHFMEDMKMIGSEDYDVWFKVIARYKMGRINKINSGIREHLNRSVNEGIYENLSYQKSLVLRNIENDPITYSKFKPYLRRLEASFYLQQAIVSNKLNNKGKAKQSLRNAAQIDPSIIFTSRYLKIFVKTIKL
jgi:glycosyltransferase involved in cell wall biosynthesis